MSQGRKAGAPVTASEDPEPPLEDVPPDPPDESEAVPPFDVTDAPPPDEGVVAVFVLPVTAVKVTTAVTPVRTTLSVVSVAV